MFFFVLSLSSEILFWTNRQMCYVPKELRLTETMLLSRVIRFKIASDLPCKG